MALYWIVHTQAQEKGEELKSFVEVFEKRGIAYTPLQKQEEEIKEMGICKEPCVLTITPITKVFSNPKELEDFLEEQGK
jgi:hypothetical protein